MLSYNVISWRSHRVLLMNVKRWENIDESWSKRCDLWIFLLTEIYQTFQTYMLSFPEINVFLTLISTSHFFSSFLSRSTSDHLTQVQQNCHDQISPSPSPWASCISTGIISASCSGCKPNSKAVTTQFTQGGEVKIPLKRQYLERFEGWKILDVQEFETNDKNCWWIFINII